MLIGAINDANGKPNSIKNLLTGQYGAVPGTCMLARHKCHE